MTETITPADLDPADAYVRIEKSSPGPQGQSPSLLIRIYLYRNQSILVSIRSDGREPAWWVGYEDFPELRADVLGEYLRRTAEMELPASTLDALVGRAVELVEATKKAVAEGRPEDVPTRKRGVSIMTPEDVKALREDYFMSLNHVSDEQLVAAFVDRDEVVWSARQWAWGDTEVRDDTYRVFRAAGLRDVGEAIDPTEGQS